jgi:hypothetical protein
LFIVGGIGMGLLLEGYGDGEVFSMFSEAKSD